MIEQFGHDLGGREVARFTEPSWLGMQLAFAGGIRLEALEPIENPRDDFLARFLEHTGPGPHHVTFKVPDIEASLDQLKSLGIEPLKVDLSDPNWKEAFLHPKLGVGTVVQLAQPGGIWAADHEPGPVNPATVQADFLGAELEVDAARAEVLFGDVLGVTGRRIGMARRLTAGPAAGRSWRIPTDGRPRVLAWCSGSATTVAITAAPRPAGRGPPVWRPYNVLRTGPRRPLASR